MITVGQIKAARAALNWSATHLSQKASLGLRTVLRIEAGTGVPQTTTGTLAKIQAALEAAGIEFVGTPDDGPGIRIRGTPNGV